MATFWFIMFLIFFLLTAGMCTYFGYFFVNWPIRSTKFDEIITKLYRKYRELVVKKDK